MVWRTAGDLIGADGESRQVAKVETGVGEEGFRVVVGPVQPIQAGRRQPVPPPLPLGLRRLQAVAQAHQLVHLGHDAALFGKGRKGKRTE